jgi:hypothetical protein
VKVIVDMMDYYVTDCSWTLSGHDIPRFAAKVIHEFWQMCGAEIASATRTGSLKGKTMYDNGGFNRSLPGTRN